LIVVKAPQGLELFSAASLFERAWLQVAERITNARRTVEERRFQQPALSEVERAAWALQNQRGL